MADDGLDHLLRLAERALEDGLSIDECITSIEAYSQAFHPWYEEHKDAFDEDAPGNMSFERSSLERLLKLHTAVLAKAESLQKGTTQDMVALRGRRKGMMAYIDTLPKRLSTRRTRKG
ncbi:MAG: hypothetical protein KDD55_06760 [Bdellovibrionales bacterium]|nr:hypothetical protein [Bdellovibrionales bacterium]